MDIQRLVIDGGLSNVLEAYGCDLNHPLWTARLLVEHPDLIVRAHLDYLQSGAQCITTSTYQASIPGLMKAGFSRTETEHLLLKSVQLAKDAVELAMDSGCMSSNPIVAASIGPYGAYLADGSEYRGDYRISDPELKAFHRDRLQILDGSEADVLACETIPSFQEARILSDILKSLKKPSWISFSCKDEKYISDGTPIEKCIALFEHHPKVFAVGVNCTAPRFISELIRRIKALETRNKIIVYPNSGEVYHASTKSWLGISEPESFLALTREWVEIGADIVGGCCRIGPQHIQLIRNIFTPSR